MLRALRIGTFAIASTTAALASGKPGSSPYELVDQFADVLARIENDYVEPAAREKLAQGAIQGMVDALDPHSAYMPPDDYDDFKADTSGQFAGIGVEVDLRNGQITVVAPIPGSPAERAGIRGGDRIVSVNGIAPDTLPLVEVVHRMRGKKGSTVRLIVRRRGNPSPLSFNVVRDDVKLPSIYVRQFDHSVAYLRITAFQEGTHAELLDKLGELASRSNYRGILLDLRQNPGGLVGEAIAVADEFLNGGLLFYTRHQGKLVDRVETTAYGHFENIPLVTLVDEGTASAAEILAGALKDRKRSAIVGARTFGKGTVQTIFDLSDGSGLRLTSMRYYTPAGLGIQASGVEPDETIVESDADLDGSMREADLPNHLPSERLSNPVHSKSSELGEPAEKRPCPITKPMESLLERIRRLPPSPKASDGKILARGFQLLVSRLQN